MSEEVLTLDERKAEMASESLATYKFYLRKRPVMLAILSVLAIAFFLAVAGLSRLYYDQRQALGARWFTRGVADLNAKKFDTAVTNFRAALLYSRDDYSYQLNLAEALIGQGHTGEASAYLLNLWEREPENGVVNLELARIAAQQGHTQEAVRYYHDAVYATWPQDEEWRRRNARVELIELLLRIQAPAEAQAELVALAKNVAEEPTQQQRLGALFLRTGDFEHALDAFVEALKADPRNPEALAGAGHAAFSLHRFPAAQHYLHEAVGVNPSDIRSADELKTTETILNMDPFRRGISAEQRSKDIATAFAVAGERLKACPLPTKNGSAGDVATPTADEEWAALKPRLTESRLQRDPDLADKATDLIFRIERQTSVVCGKPTGTDLALLLIAQDHEAGQ